MKRVLFIPEPERTWWLSDILAHIDEIVVIDTGSIDDSLNIAYKYADKVMSK